jgi:ribosomal protein S18 acetylase RimI-like enzyme
MRLRTPERRDAEAISVLSRAIMDDIAPDSTELAAQLHMFPQGSFIVEELSEDGTPELVGLVSAVLWAGDYEPNFGKLHGVYTHTHFSSGNVLFIHTLIVKPEFRKKGLGNKLIGAEINFAALLEVDHILAISSTNSLHIFERLGFSIRRPLPEFLPYHQDRFPQPMLMELKMR